MACASSRASSASAWSSGPSACTCISSRCSARSPGSACTGQHLVGGDAQLQGTNIVIKTLVMNVNHECTGIFVIMLFASFVLAYPASWLARLGGLAVGIPLLFVVNVVRLATLARIVEVYPDAFFYFHEYVWQGIFMVLVLVGSISWAERFG